jgi:signal transduction histidine kinase
MQLVARALDGDVVEIRIGNSGPAIPLEAQAVIFEKFGQLASGPSNLGLGLYFCRLAVEAHGGTIRVENAPEFPTDFVIELRQGPATHV